MYLLLLLNLLELIVYCCAENNIVSWNSRIATGKHRLGSNKWYVGIGRSHCLDSLVRLGRTVRCKERPAEKTSTVICNQKFSR